MFEHVVGNELIQTGGSEGEIRLFSSRFQGEGWELNPADLSVTTTYGLVFGEFNGGCGGYGPNVYASVDASSNFVRKYDADDGMSQQASSAWSNYTNNGGRPRGGGGDSSGIWFVDQDRSGNVWKVDPDDLSELSHQTGLSNITSLQGCGGDSSTLWVGGLDGTRFHYDPSDYSLVKSGGNIGETSPASGRSDIGGTSSKVWYIIDYPGSNTPDTGEVFELDVNDFSIIRQRYTSENNAPSGIGGGFTA